MYNFGKAKFHYHFYLNITKFVGDFEVCSYFVKIANSGYSNISNAQLEEDLFHVSTTVG